MRILHLCVLLSAVGYADSQVLESDVELHRGFNIRQWLHRFFTKKVRNILSPLNRKDAVLERIMIKVEFDSQPFWLYFDTGSSLTWIPMENITQPPSGHHLNFSNYYRPKKGFALGRFRRQYGESRVQMFAEGRMYRGPFSKSRRILNMTYGVADRVDFNGIQYAGIFGASKMHADSTVYPIIMDPLTRSVIPNPTFTISLRPWTGFEPFEPIRRHMGNIEIGGLDPDHCYSRVTYSPPTGGGFWEVMISRMRFGTTTFASANISFVHTVPVSDVRAVLDTGSPVVGFPLALYEELGIGDGSQAALPRFHCNDTDFDAQLHLEIAGRWVRLDRRHLMFPEDNEGHYCSLKIIPSLQPMLGLPFYAAAGCVVHDYAANRVGIANRRPDNSSRPRSRIMKEKVVEKFHLYS